ncbi:MAG: hypothetical protein L6R41_004162 [Letrouitia leprolyta]|nr:MAG: hypothetical protein L6R41_004162 [Letrouitia leprolyta]
MADATFPSLADEAFPWHLGVFDAHCHPTDTVASQDDIPKMKARALVIMATRYEDQDIVRQFVSRYGVQPETVETLWNQDHNCNDTQLVPSFGWHPWFSYLTFDDSNSSSSTAEDMDATQHYKSVLSPSPTDEFISSLPKPRPLSDLLHHLRGSLENFPYAIVGEIGIDRSFRLPMHWTRSGQAERNEGLTPGGREGRRLSPYRLQIDHQRKILKAQLHLAGELGRPVSVHGVAAHGILYETLKETWQGQEIALISKRERKRRTSAANAHANQEVANSKSEKEERKVSTSKSYPPRICLHSYSGPVDALRQYLEPSVPATIYFSFSRLVNFSNRSQKAIEVVKAIPNDRILVESDLHSAGNEMDKLLEDIVRLLCSIKGWSLTEGVELLAKNFRDFVFADRLEDQNPLCGEDENT